MGVRLSHTIWMLLTDQAGALLNFEAAARLEAFRGDLDSARRVFRGGAERCPSSARFLREWGAFEKRAGSLDVSALAIRSVIILAIA